MVTINLNPVQWSFPKTNFNILRRVLNLRQDVDVFEVSLK